MNMKHSLLALAFLISCSTALADTNGTIIGATRWDAYYVPVSQPINKAVSRVLGQQKWQQRAPWFSVPKGANEITINGTQDTMDTEIAYARESEIGFWNFLWYGASHDMQRGWRLFQSSTHKADINWIQMHQVQLLCGPLWAKQYSEIIGYFQQSNYQKVLSGRPVWVIYYDGGSAFQNCYGGSWGTFRASLDAFRKAVTSAGLPNPYVILAYNSPSGAKDGGFDAVSSYTPKFGNPKVGGKPWSEQDTETQAYWATLRSGALNQSIDAVPIAATGWDLRPRKERPVPWETPNKKQHAPSYTNTYATLPTPSQLTGHLQAMVDSIVSNPTVSKAKLGLIYAWNECDEGGNCIVPTYDATHPAVPNTAILNAVKAVNF